MNTQLRSWFSQGKAAEALCGFGGYFMAGVTYREEHDFVLAVGELLEWGHEGHIEEAARAIETGITTLLDTGRLENALRLLRSYYVLQKETNNSLPFDERLVASQLGKAVSKAGQRLAQDERLRTLLLSVAGDFPQLKATLGLEENVVSP
jgi:hypothetical protein